MVQKKATKSTTKSISNPKHSGKFHVQWKNDAQALAWAVFQQHDVLFLIGTAGTGKSFCACAFACEQIINKERSKIVLTRPIVEAGESIGYLPGEFEEKVAPYMMPMYDCLDIITGREGIWKDMISRSIEVAPLAFMRGRTFQDAVCIFDEAQNATYSQLKLFLSRFHGNTKVIITGDPTQSDLGGKVALVEVMQRLKGLDGVGIVEFKANSIVRHPLVGKILERLEQ